jgi:hypothetical protein
MRAKEGKALLVLMRAGEGKALLVLSFALAADGTRTFAGGGFFQTFKIYNKLVTLRDLDVVKSKKHAQKKSFEC